MLNCISIYYIRYVFRKSGFSILPVQLLYFKWQWGGTGFVYLGYYVFMSMKILLLIGYKAGLYDIMDAICMVWCRENSMKTGRNGE